MNQNGYHIITCATVAEELKQLGVSPDSMTVLEFGLHVYPDRLKERLQQAIDAVPGDCDILLGYGLCSNAVVGLSSGSHRLIIPRVDDCIALFLGSRAEHLARLAEAPGTYYLTKGWVEAQWDTIAEYARLVEKYGEKRARKVAEVMYKNYTRVVLINTGNYRMDEYRDFARAMAEFLDLEFVEIPGSNRMLEKMLAGDWEHEFLVVPPGTAVDLAPFEVGGDTPEPGRN
jgi:Protein of unknown function (DUF1638)